MGDYDDVIEMGEAVKQLGDEPPVIEDPPAPAEEPPPAEEKAAPPPQEDESGGLGDPLEEQSDNQLDIDKLLGLDKAQQGEEQPEQDPPVEEAPPQEAPPPGSLEERFAELTGQVKMLKEDNARLATHKLQEPPTPPAEVPPAPELEQEMVDYLNPYIDAAVEKRVGERLGKVEKAIEPVVEQSHNDRLAGVIGQHVEGFKPSDMTTLYKELDSGKLSEQDEALYRDGVSGAILLARELQGRGALGGVKKTTKRASPLAARHHSETSGFTPASQDDMSEEEKVRRLMAVDPAAIRDMVDGLE